MRTGRKSWACAGATLCLAVMGSAPGAALYRNTMNDQMIRVEPGTMEVGNEIYWDGTNTTRQISSFAFEYWGTNSGATGGPFDGNVQARIRFYLNDGPSGQRICHLGTLTTPGTIIFDSGWMSNLVPTLRSVLILGPDSFTALAGYVPTNQIIWTVQFQGMGATDHVGLDIYGPPEVGATLPYYWMNTGTNGWAGLVGSNMPVVFAAALNWMDFDAKLDSLTRTLSGQFAFHLSSEPSKFMTIESSTNLHDWAAAGSVYPTVSLWFTNATPVSTTRFFRASTTAVQPGLSVPFLPLTDVAATYPLNYLGPNGQLFECFPP